MKRAFGEAEDERPPCPVAQSSGAEGQAEAR